MCVAHVGRQESTINTNVSVLLFKVSEMLYRHILMTVCLKNRETII